MLNRNVLVGLALVFAIAGCKGGGGGFSQQARAGKTDVFRYPIVTSPTSLDPHTVEDGDTIDLFEVPAGAKIDEILEVHSAHGGTAALTLGWKYKDGSASGAGTPSATALKASFSTVAAGNSVGGINPAALFPIQTASNGVVTNQSGVVDKPIIVYATHAGSAIPLNGEIYVKASGEFVGTK